MNEIDPRLTRLLRLKQNERPHDAFLEGVSVEFHRRLRAEQRRAQTNPLGTVLSRFMDALTVNPLPALRWFGASFGTVTACGVALMLLRPPAPRADVAAPAAAPAIAVAPAATAAAASIAATEPAAPAEPLDAAISVASLAEDDGFDQGVFMQTPAWSGRDFRLQPAAPAGGGEVVPVSYDEAGVPF
jgi:hypothetical protein